MPALVALLLAYILGFHLAEAQNADGVWRVAGPQLRFVPGGRFCCKSSSGALVAARILAERPQDLVYRLGKLECDLYEGRPIAAIELQRGGGVVQYDEQVRDEHGSLFERRCWTWDRFVGD